MTRMVQIRIRKLAVPCEKCFKQAKTWNALRGVCVQERKGSSGDLGTESKPVCELQTAEKSPQGFMTKSRTGFA